MTPLKRSFVALAATAALTAGAVAPAEAATSTTSNSSTSSTGTSSQSELYNMSSEVGSSDIQSWFNTQDSGTKSLLAALTGIGAVLLALPPLRTIIYNLFHV